jgi:hypothetical protein
MSRYAFANTITIGVATPATTVVQQLCLLLVIADFKRMQLAYRIQRIESLSDV